MYRVENCELNLSLVFNLVNNIDVEATKDRIDQYKRANEDVIARNRLQQQAEEKTLELSLENERRGVRASSRGGFERGSR